MNSKFYEEECLPYVKRVANDVNWLYENGFDRDEVRDRIEELDTKAVEDEDGLDEDEQDELEELREKLEKADWIGAGDLYEYMNDVLDIEYTIDSHGEYLGCCVYVTLGGPSVWIDTRNQSVELRWGSDRASWCIWSDTADAIDEIFEESYRCIR